MRLGKLLSVGEAADREPAGEARPSPGVTVPEADVPVAEVPAPAAGR